MRLIYRVVVYRHAKRGVTPITRRWTGWSLAFVRHARSRFAGFSLAECLCALALVGSVSWLALPSLESLAQRWRVDLARDRWLSDLDVARSWSARHGAVSMLSRRTDCPGLSDARDWRCGWRVVTADSSEVLSDTPLPGDLSLTYSTITGELRIAATGDPMSAGASLRIKPWRAEWASLATTICLNIAGRVHWQAGEGCT